MDILNKFLKDCLARGLTKHTVETYKSSISAFLDRFPDPSQVTLENLVDFLEDLRAQNLQSSTLKGSFAALNTFFDYLVFTGHLISNLIPSFRKRYLTRLKFNGAARQLISVQDMRILVSAAPSILERTILLLLAKIGMRRGELLALKYSDVDLKTNTIRLPKKAKRTNRIAFIGPELHETLEEYLAWREPRAKSDWLLVSKHGGRIHKDLPGKILAALGIQNGLHDPKGPLSKKLTPHCFRHWFTTHLFRAGMDPQYIMWLRGDSMGKQSWQLYNFIDPEQVRADYEKRIPKLL